MPKEADSANTDVQQPAIGCLVRLFWMMFGNVALVFAGLEVAGSDRIGTTDAVYSAVVVALIVARYVDVNWLHGMTAQAEPATRAHLRTYVFALIALAAVGWLAARLLSGAFF